MAIAIQVRLVPRSSDSSQRSTRVHLTAACIPSKGHRRGVRGRLAVPAYQRTNRLPRGTARAARQATRETLFTFPPRRIGDRQCPFKLGRQMRTAFLSEARPPLVGHVLASSAGSGLRFFRRDALQLREASDEIPILDKQVSVFVERNAMRCDKDAVPPELRIQFVLRPLFLIRIIAEG